jgi:hypothetical protein
VVLSVVWNFFRFPCEASSGLVETVGMKEIRASAKCGQTITVFNDEYNINIRAGPRYIKMPYIRILPSLYFFLRSSSLALELSPVALALVSVTT